MVTGIVVWVVTGIVVWMVNDVVVWMGAGHSKLIAGNPSSHWIQVVICNPSSAYPGGHCVQFTVPVSLVTVPALHIEHVGMPVSK